VRNVDIDVNDDCITIKSGKDADGLRVNRPSEDIIVENSRMHYGHGGWPWAARHPAAFATSSRGTS